MAKWRALHGDISSSEQIIDLTEFEQLLFTWMIPHADDWGIITGKLRGLKVKVMPATERSLEEIDEALQHIEEAGLIWRYEADGHGALVQLKSWDDRQPIRKDRRVDGKHPDHVGQMPTTGCQMSAKTRLDNTRQDNTRPEVEPPPFSSIFTEVTGVLVATGTQAQDMDAWMEDVSEEWFRQACTAAVDNNARKWAYVRAVLKRCKSEGKAPGEGKRGKSGRRDQDDDPEGFNADAARLQAEREANAG